MLTAVPRMLLTGPPRVGKTTLVGRLAGELPAVGVTVGGFLTREIREDGERVGFAVEEIGGSSALLAHVALPEGSIVGRYHVDVAAFEGLALPAIQRATRRGGTVIIDELGQMELFSPALISSFNRLHPLIGNAGRLPGRARETRVRSGSGGHVCGEDVVRVAVQVLAGPL
jgi:nucleoside-triphosphatase THEP1